MPSVIFSSDELKASTERAASVAKFRQRGTCPDEGTAGDIPQLTISTGITGRLVTFIRALF